MAEQTFKSPGFFENEVDLTIRERQISGIPAGVIGTAKFGPAFVPVTVGSMSDFVNKFGDLDADRFGPYAVNEFLKNRNALTYVRVLGAGANSSTADITSTELNGTVKNAGFIIKGTVADSFGAMTGVKYHAGSVQFIVASHALKADTHEADGYPIFSRNSSFNRTLAGAQHGTTGLEENNVIRGMVFLASGSRMMILDHNGSYSPGIEIDKANTAKISSYDGTKGEGTFKLVISSGILS